MALQSNSDYLYLTDMLPCPTVFRKQKITLNPPIVNIFFNLEGVDSPVSVSKEKPRFIEPLSRSDPGLNLSGNEVILKHLILEVAI